VSPGEPVDFLTLEDLLDIAVGVLGDLRIRDLGLLAAAAARPATTAFGADAYPSTTEKAAALMHSLARNHPLVDGNKRLAWSALRAFLLLNGHDIRYGVDEAESFVLAVAAGELDAAEIAGWLDPRLVHHS